MIVLRGIAIDAHNNEHDYETAWTAIQMAERLARSPDQQERVQQDRKAIEPSLADRTCFFCAKRDAESQHAITTDMHGDFAGQVGAMNYKKGQIRVPRCKKCCDIDSYLVAGGALSFVVGLGLGISLNDLSLTVVGMLLVGVFVLVRRSIYGKPAISRHPRIANLLKTGWFFGAGPK